MATISYTNLSGSRENLDLTIKDLLNDNWTAGNITGTITPHFECDSEEADQLARPDDAFLNSVRVNYVSRVRLDEDEFDTNGDAKHAWVCTVFIEIEAEDLTQLLDMEDEVNRILWDNRPNGGTRLPKSDGNDSEVAYFDKSEIEFERLEPDDADEDFKPTSQAELRMIYYRIRT